MANTKTPASVPVTGYVGNYGQSYIDLVSLAGAVPEIKEQVLAKLYRQEGDGAKLLDLLRIVGNEFFVKGERLTAFEEIGVKGTVTVAAAGPAAIGHTAGDPIYFQLSSSDYSASGSLPLRVAETVYLPGTLFNKDYPVAAQVITSYTSGSYGGLTAGSGASRVWEVKILEGVKLQSDITASTILSIGATLFGRGAGQPEPKNYLNYQRDFYTGISKETVEIEGGVQAMERQVAFDIDGQMRVWDAGLARAEFSLDKQIEHQLWVGNLNTGDVTLNNTESGAPTKTKSTKGLLPTVADSASRLVLDSGLFNGLEDFDDIRDLQLANNVIADINLFITNPALYTQVENTVLTASDNGAATLYDKEMQMFGIPFKRVMKNNRIYYLVELSTLANPRGLGATTLGTGPNGFVIPLENVATNVSNEITFGNVTYGPMSGKVTIPNIAVGYLNNNGENRRKIIQPVAGVNGMGLPASNQYDSIKGFLLSEYMLTVMTPNKIVWIK
jgi:hypothetical protein